MAIFTGPSPTTASNLLAKAEAPISRMPGAISTNTYGFNRLVVTSKKSAKNDRPDNEFAARFSFPRRHSLRTRQLGCKAAMCGASLNRHLATRSITGDVPCGTVSRGAFFPIAALLSWGAAMPSRGLRLRSRDVPFQMPARSPSPSSGMRPL